MTIATFMIIQLLVVSILISIGYWVIRRYRQARADREDLMGLYERIFQNSYNSMMLVRPTDGRIVDANDAAARYYGYPAEKLRQMSVIELNTMPSDRHIALMQEMGRAERQTYDFEQRLADGRVEYVEATISPVHYRGEDLLFAVLRDLSDQHERERFLMLERELSLSGNQAVERKQWLAHSAQLIAAFGDICGCAAFLTEAETGLLGLVACASDDEAVCRVLRQDAMLRMAGDWMRAGGSHYEADFRHFCSPDDDQCPVGSILSCPIPDADGRQGILLCVSARPGLFSETAREHLEFTAGQIGGTLQRLEAERLRTEADTRWKFALEGAGDVMIEFLADGRLAYASDSIEELLGLPRDHLESETYVWTTRIPPEEVGMLQKAIRQILDGTSERYSLEHRILRADGSEAWVLHRGCAVAWKEDGAVERILATLTNITPQKDFERELVSAKGELERANNVKSLFLANISHELRTPMNGILGMLQLLELSGQDEEQMESLQIMKDSSRRMMTLINNLITYTSIEAGELSLYEQRFNLREAMEECMSMVRYDAASKGIALKTEIGSIPEQVVGDREKIQMVVSQLLDNAVKFTEAGSVTLRVAVGDMPGNAVRAEGIVRIAMCVTDTGIGIRQEDMRHLFTNFTQVDPSYTRLYKAVASGRNAPPREGCVGWVLVVDDDEVSRRLLGIFCEKSDLEVHYASGAREAIQLNDTHDFDIIFMDIQMPEMSGLEASKIINRNNAERERPARIIAVTAYALKGDRERFLEEGMHDYIAKPVDNARLQQAIRRWIGTDAVLPVRSAER